MLFERIESEGLAHYSYLSGAAGEAVVVDPRRDVDIYIQKTEENGYHLKYILETHRNEDYLIGSLELAEKTGAEIWHADTQLPYEYGNPVRDGQEWSVGALTVKAIRTPGHTEGSFSYLLSEPSGAPLIVFTGDALFAGEVGRVDLLGKERIAEMAGLLHESIFKKLLPLGDGVLVCPAHGAGSACGSSIGDRPWTTIGIERLHNQRLRYHEREAFIAAVGQELEKPCYFKNMENANLSCKPLLSTLPVPRPLPPPLFAETAQSAVVLDTRVEGFGPAHIPGSLCIWMGGISSFTGWFLSPDEPLLLVCEMCHLETLAVQLRRMGYNRIEGYLAGGILAWHKDGRDTQSTATVTVPELCERLDSGGETWILDVRSREELEHAGEITGAQHIHVTQIDERSPEVPRDRQIFIFCGSGLRSMIAASILQKKGWKDLVVVLGGFSAWKSVSCPIKTTG